MTHQMDELLATIRNPETHYPDNRKHRIYGLVDQGCIFYVGYCAERSPYLRLKEHVASALNPTTARELNNAIRGSETAKNQTILEAIQRGEQITIQVLHECSIYEPIDEQEWITEYQERARREGYELTNIAVGRLWETAIPVKSVRHVNMPKKRAIPIVVDPKQLSWVQFKNWHDKQFDSHWEFTVKRWPNSDKEKTYNDHMGSYIRYLDLDTAPDDIRERYSPTK